MANSNNFESLVRSACQVEMQVRGMSDNPKMSLASFIHACLQRADASIETLDTLRRLIDEQPIRFRNSRAFIRQAMSWFSSGRVSSGVPKDTSRMALPSRDDAALELIGTNFGLYLLWCLAGQNAHAKDSSIFGPDIDLDEYRAKYRELKAQADFLIESINQSFLPGDTVVSEPDSNGRVLVTFKIAEGKVPTHPLANCGRRLINHLLDSDPSWALPIPSREPTQEVKRYAKQASG